MSQITLIIPDIHLQWQIADEIIKKVNPNKIIFLGDYFDDYLEDPEQVTDMCDWLNNSVQLPNRIHLFGNHDQHYAFPYRIFQCSGYRQWKYTLINDLVPRKTWDKLKWYHILDNTFFLCHGGLHYFNVPEHIKKMYKDRKEMYKALDVFLKKEISHSLQHGGVGWIFSAGASRGGNQRVGGLTWCDFSREFKPTKGINQIVGHTPQTDINWCILQEDDQMIYRWGNQVELTKNDINNVEKSYNLGLDSSVRNHYAIWDGETIKTYKLM